MVAAVAPTYDTNESVHSGNERTTEVALAQVLACDTAGTGHGAVYDTRVGNRSLAHRVAHNWHIDAQELAGLRAALLRGTPADGGGNRTESRSGRRKSNRRKLAGGGEPFAEPEPRLMEVSCTVYFLLSMSNSKM